MVKCVILATLFTFESFRFLKKVVLLCYTENRSQTLIKCVMLATLFTFGSVRFLTKVRGRFSSTLRAPTSFLAKQKKKWGGKPDNIYIVPK